MGNDQWVKHNRKLLLELGMHAGRQVEKLQHDHIGMNDLNRITVIHPIIYKP